MSESEFVGNALCLDFVNTVNKRPDPDRDRLDTVEGLMHWAQAAGLGTMTQPPDRPVTLVAVCDLREAVHRVFAAIASADRPAAGDLAAVTGTYAEAVAAAGLQRDGSRFTLHWPPPLAVDQLRWMVAASAMHLLLDGPLDRVGACPSCGWLFLDTSRNGRRRWCSMAVCGGRVKAERHYARTSDRRAGVS